MNPDTPEHDAMAAFTPGTDEEEQKQITCPECGHEHTANAAVIAITEAYTCPECDSTTSVNNHLGLFVVVLVVVVIYFKIRVGVRRAKRWAYSKVS